MVVEQQILRFQIPMHNIQRVNILNSGHDLLKELAGFLLGYTRLLDDVVEEFATAGKFHDQVELARSLNDLVELNDIGVPDQLENVDLTRDSFDISHVTNSILLQNLDRNTFLSQLVLAFAYFTKSAFANLFLNVVVAYDFAALGMLNFCLGGLLSFIRARFLHFFVIIA